MTHHVHDFVPEELPQLVGVARAKPIASAELLVLPVVIDPELPPQALVPVVIDLGSVD